MKTSKTESQSEREILLTRVVEAPRELVWRIWTEPEHVPLWWGPTGFTTTTQEMEVRAGGRWRFTMHGPDGRDYPNLVVYLEVDPPGRLVYEHVGEEGIEPTCFKTIVTLEELGPARTRVSLQSIFPSAQARDFVVREYGALEGGKQHLARMAEHAASLASRAGASRDFVMHRVFDAPRALVYRVWTEVEHLARWFGPEGCTLSGCKLDLRPGGSFLYCMSFSGKTDHWGKWVFREIVPGERLVFTVSFADEKGTTVRAPFDERWPLTMLSSVTFEDHAGIGGGTVVTLRWSALDASREEQQTFDEGHASMRQGWTGTFDRLAEHLAALRTRS